MHKEDRAWRHIPAPEHTQVKGDVFCASVMRELPCDMQNKRKQQQSKINMQPWIEQQRKDFCFEGMQKWTNKTKDGISVSKKVQLQHKAIKFKYMPG